MPTKKELEAENAVLKEMILGLGGDPTLTMENYIKIGDYIYPKNVPVELFWEGEYEEFKRDDSWYFEEHGDAIREILDAWNIEYEDYLDEFVVYGGTHWEDTRTGIQAKISKSCDSFEQLIAECELDDIE